MNFKKRVNGSWTDTSHYIHNTSTDAITTLPTVIYPTDTTATVGLKGQTLQSSIPSPTSPVMPQGTGDKTANLFDIASWIIANESTYTKSGNNYTFDTRQSMYSTPYYFSETDIAISISGILENVSSVNARIDLLHADGTVSSGNVITDSQAKSENIYAAGLRFNWSTGGTVTLSNIMLNTGSTALPYEPYGYKIPISSGGENLFDYPQDNYSTTINSVVWTIENGVIKGEGFTTSQGRQDCILVRKNGLYWSGNYPNYYFLNASTDMKLPAGTYTFSYIPITEPTTISLRPRLIIGHEGGRYIDGTAKFVWNGDTFTVDSDDYVALALNTSNSIGEYEFGKFMLNLGATALPYEPYNRTTTPIYLGEVQTTRRIKKLVLTGEEFVYVYANADIAFRINTSDAMLNYRYCVCTHFSYQRTPGHSTIDGVTAGAGDYNLYFTFSSSSATQFGVVAGDTNSFKSFLQQQYAAGTPVTAWYVLATPETAVVNEPLRKIGDYADTVSGITIPTIAGANTLSIGTTLQPSEVTVNYKGWHPVQSVHERDNSAWT